MQRKANTERRKKFKRDFARELRNGATEAERILWLLLRGSKMDGLKFRRQQTIGPYVVDFLCPALKLIVELDGSQHGLPENAAYDSERTRWLDSRGFRVIRFPNADVTGKRHDVADAIWHAAKATMEK